MSLQSGSFVGPYEILAPLGAGGMGEVYKARDPKLNRHVAIKVLPATLANDTDYLARFQREAQSLAALNHPNIATIYGLEQNAIVMELVDGQPLQGPKPIDEVRQIAKQIAEALEAAHEKGIIHRDLKPANILLTPEGQVKILDFGLAKAVETSTQSDRTLTLGATEAGLILGTAAYMSPEQAAGKPVDRRADIWSFGVVLHELLTGKKLFDGETVSHTLAEVLKTEIDFTKIPAGPLRDLLARCLDRNSKTRLQHIGEARIALETYKEITPATPARRTNWLAAAALALIAAAGTGAISWRLLRPEPPPFLRLSVNLGSDAVIQGVGRNRNFDLSADGRKIVYTTRGPMGIEQLAIRQLDREQPALLPGTDNPVSPFFSPDGEWIVFASSGKLRKVASSGGTPISLCDAPNLRGGTFNSAGDIIAALNIRGGLALIPKAGGTPRPFTTTTGSDITHRWPHALPGDAGVVFISSDTPGTYENAVIEFASPKGDRKVLHRGGYMPRYLASGHLTFMSQGKLFAALLDLRKMELAALPVAVLHDVGAEAGGGLAPVAASDNGLFLFRTGIGQRNSTLAFANAAGKVDRLPLKPLEIASFHLSPDGEQIALGTGNGELVIYNVARDLLTRLQTHGGNPLWTPDGKQLVCGTENGMTLLSADGTGSQLRFTSDTADTPGGWGPNASVLYFMRNTALWRLPLDWSGGGPPKPGTPSRVKSAGAGGAMRVSPDGRFGTGSSTLSGNYEVVVYALAGDTGGNLQITTDGGLAPTWNPRGSELFYVRPDGRIMVVPYRVEGDRFLPGKPHPLELAEGLDTQRGIAISPDGKRYLSLARPDGEKDAPKSEFILLLGFFDELKRRLTAGK